jgi:MoaA/NifB/PqqE/SkfB family radical SAM enzyme
MIYSPFKAARHTERIEKLMRGELILPTHIQIDITNECNHRCAYCFYRVARNETLNALFYEDDSISLDRMKTLLDEFKEIGIPSIQYTGGGEPMAHPDFYEILKRTIENGLEYALVTNGDFDLEDKWFSLFKKAAWIRVSLDAFYKETYARSQGTSEEGFERVIKNIKAINENCPHIVMGISFVINPINYREILLAAKLAKDLGVDNIRLSVAYTPRRAELFDSRWHEIESQAAEATELEDGKFRVFNLVSAHLETLQYKKKGYGICGYQHFTTAIGADGVLYPCCTLKYNPLSAFGNIKEKTFLEIWEGETRRAWLKSNHLKNVCNKNPCWMDRKNQFISYLVTKRVKHENFV